MVYLSLLLIISLKSSLSIGSSDPFILTQYPSFEFDGFSGETMCVHNAEKLFRNFESGPERLSVVLPTFGTVTFRRKTFEKPLIGQSEFEIWNGEASDFRAGRASFVLLPNSRLNCQIQVENKFFKCKPCSLAGGNAKSGSSTDCVDLVQIESGSLVTKAESVGLLPFKHTFSNEKRTLQLEQNTTNIDIAVLYTNYTVFVAGNEDFIKADILTAVSYANEVFENQSLNIKFRIVFWSSYEYNETGSASDAYTFLQSDANVDSIRSEYGADLVYFVTSDGQFGYESCFLAASNSPEPFDTFLRYYPIIVIDSICFESYVESLVSTLAFHLGCTKDYENSSKDQMVEYSYAYQSESCDFSTILGLSCGEESVKIPYFSSPDFQWAKTGEIIGSETANCARVIGENAAFVADYKMAVENVELYTNSPASMSAAEGTSTLVVEAGNESSLAPTLAPTFSPTNVLTVGPTFGFMGN